MRPKFAEVLDTAALKRVRIGVLEPLFGDASDGQEVIGIIRASVEEFKKQGATAVSLPMPQLTAALDGSSVINTEFKEDLANYLATSGNPPVHTLEEIVHGGLIHASLAENLNARLASPGRDSREYKLALAKRAAVQQIMLKLMEDQKLAGLSHHSTEARAHRRSRRGFQLPAQRFHWISCY